MREMLCKFGFHRYKSIGIQKATGVVAGFAMCPILREVNVCQYCKKTYYYGLNISTNAHLNNTLNWKPQINYENKRY